MTQQLYWAYVGFTDIADGKTRPVLYIRQTDTDYVVFRLSSQYENKSAFIKSKYVEIKNWQQAGLKKPSWIIQYKHISCLSKKHNSLILDNCLPMIWNA